MSMPVVSQDDLDFEAYPEPMQDTGNGTEEHSSRVWRACVECRKKKSKCDGQETCKRCLTRGLECMYPASRDNASTSRQFAAIFEARCQHMEELCQQMGTLMSRFASTVESLDGLRQNGPQFSPGINQPLFDLGAPVSTSAPTSFIARSSKARPEFASEVEIPLATPAVSGNGEGEEDRESGDDLPEDIGNNAMDHVMTTDSYGKLRFVGGPSTMEMIEALKSLSPTANHDSPEGSPAVERSVSLLELPFFVRGKTFPPLPYLPRPELLNRPPRYVSDLLINIYFDQLHYTMPVVYKPHFLQRYNILVNDRTGTNVDAGFLSVFFAVCACASGLLPRGSDSSSTFPGMQYYENAILLHYASTGEGTIEQVQCLALLSMCSAGWNTLAQSWKFAGQAVRAAQDLGLHRSPARGVGDTLKEELCRRIWWSVYGLDRVLSICLGRPMGVEDQDCDCELPLDMDDEDLGAYCKGTYLIAGQTLGPSRLTGFLVFSRLCRIAGKIARSMSLLQLRRMRENGHLKRAELRTLVKTLDAELADWLNQVPDSIKFSANNPDSNSPHLTMCVISYIVHSGCVINLHRPLIPDSSAITSSITENPSHMKCVNAARSCIHVAELIHERVPPSHHLAFCTHYLAMSGVFLIRSSKPPTEDLVADTETCAGFLSNLEAVWSGARRSRLIIEELLKQSRSSQSKRTFSEMEAFDISDLTFPQELFADLF